VVFIKQLIDVKKQSVDRSLFDSRDDSSGWDK
jgi:hypothetical protein